MMTIVLLTTALLAAASQESKPSDCRDAMVFQVLLDRQGFSTGEIDGRLGANTSRALAAFREARGLPPSEALDCATLDALGRDTAVVVDYTLTADDAAGPFATTIPDDLVEQSKLPALAYQSILERLAERFHAAPALLERLNRGARFAEGETVKVPNVEPFDDRAKPPSARKGEPPSHRVEVSQEGSLRVWRSDGTLAFFAPVTSGSEHDPLPLGEWKVLSVTWMPVFNYNPDLFWDADPSHTKARIKAGPNNPVGTVWIDINVEHYGIHGTPEPSRIGHSQSHGCVRLTNWDAARVAALVGPGTPVVFK